MYNFVFGTLPADGLALLGTRTSADTVMTKFGSCIYVVPAPAGLTHCPLGDFNKILEK